MTAASAAGSAAGSVAGPAAVSTFAGTIVQWQERDGRNDLPWQGSRDPYRIWLAEIMLQQTQVATVIAYYLRFLTAFPDVAALARAPVDEVMRLWAGLGYYSRARNLHRAAVQVMGEFNGRFPTTRDPMQSLPGVGRSTAAAVVAFAYGQHEAILDGNVKRVLTRHFAIEGYPGERAVEKKLWALAESLLPAPGTPGIERYTQGLMDLGATICALRRPRCAACPVAATCAARAVGKVEVLPTPRPRKAIPHRDTYVLVLHDQTSVLIERRPPTGIWGGLWSFPEAASVAEANELAVRKIGSTSSTSSTSTSEPFAWERMPVLRHSFTHFTLSITPLVARVARRANQVESPGRLWLALGEASDAALPVPVKKIIIQLRDYLTAGHPATLFEET